MEFTAEDIEDLKEVGIGECDIPSNMRWGRILAKSESTVAIQQLRTIAWFNFGIVGNTFCEDHTSLFLEIDTDIQDFFRQLSTSFEIPPEILNLLLSTQQYAFKIEESVIQHLKKYCFPKTEKKKKSYARIFSSKENQRLSEKSFSVHRQLMQG